MTVRACPLAVNVTVGVPDACVWLLIAAVPLAVIEATNALPTACIPPSEATPEATVCVVAVPLAPKRLPATPLEVASGA
jgi:hypothetical protein